MLKSLLQEANTKCKEPMTSIECVYKCFECLISGKSVNFLILESCLHYENIHSMIQRQKLLADICVELLANYFPQKYREKAPIFLDKFILANQTFFKTDSAIIAWMGMLETNVYFEPNDFGMEYTQIDDDKKTVSESVEITINLETEKKEKMHCESNFNPFSTHESSPVYNIIEQELMGHKNSMLPNKRNMYASLYKGDLNRYGQKDNFIDPEVLQKTLYGTEEKQKNLVNFLVNGSDSDSSEEEPSLVSCEL